MAASPGRTDQVTLIAAQCCCLNPVCLAMSECPGEGRAAAHLYRAIIWSIFTKVPCPKQKPTKTPLTRMCLPLQNVRYG